MALLEVADLRTHLTSRRGVNRAVDGVSFKLDTGKSLGIVGESGSGKSMTALSILRLVPQPYAKIVGGSIRFDGEDLLEEIRARDAAASAAAASRSSCRTRSPASIRCSASASRSANRSAFISACRAKRNSPA